jgi:hypothetical protein
MKQTKVMQAMPMLALCVLVATPQLKNMTTAQVAEYLGIQPARVIRLEREHLLVPVDKGTDGKYLFDRGDVERYRDKAARLGGN